MTPAGPVPIVPAAVIFDLAVGTPRSPDAAAGRAAYEARGPLAEMARGAVGAGRGATVAKLDLTSLPERGGIGFASVPTRGGWVAAITVVNAAGIVVDPETGYTPDGGAAAGLRGQWLDGIAEQSERTSTTLSVVLVSVPSDRRTLHRCAIAAHDGLARAIRPCHTIFDGDVVFAAALQHGEPAPAEIFAISLAAELAVERSVLDAVTSKGVRT